MQKGDIFQVIGSFGLWQKRVFVVLLFYNMTGIMQNFAITFLAPNIDYRCVEGEYEVLEQNILSSVFRNFSDFASHPPLNSTDDNCHVILRDNKTDDVTSNNTYVVPCKKWEYDLSFYQKTIVSEWDLVCKREWLVSFAKSAYMIGFMASMIVFGQLADHFGRYPTIVICFIITIISGILSAFSQSYIMFVILRFLSAFGRTGLTTTGYVLLMEITGPDKRIDVGVSIQIAWGIGMVLLPALAWIIRPWNWLQFSFSALQIPFVFAYSVMPESPRWLITQGKKEELEKVVKKACKLNKREPEFDVDSLMQEKKTTTEGKRTVLDLVKTTQMRKRTICMSYLWLVNAFVYYNLSYNTNDLGSDTYLNFLLSSLTEFPSLLAIYCCMRLFSRRVTLILGMFSCAASFAAMMVVPSDPYWLMITVAMVGKLLVTMTFGMLYVYTAELFPTVIRNTAFGCCSTCARVGSTAAPFLRELGKSVHHTVPSGVNTVLAVTCGILAIFLPETKDKNIPDTIEEAEEFVDESIRFSKGKVTL